MKKIFLLTVLALSIIISSCSDDTIVGSGDLISEFRDVDAFTKLRTEGTFEVNITIGATQSIEIVADDNIIDYVRTIVVNNELQLSMDDEYDAYNNADISANLVVTSLSSLENSGSGNISASGISENSTFEIKNSGSGNISLEGTANSLNLNNEGSGNVLGFGFSVLDCDVDIEGSGNLEITCSELLKVKIEGSGNVYYKGNPTIDSSITGSGEVINSN